MTITTKAALLLVALIGIYLLFSDSIIEPDPRTKARQLYSALADIVENDASRSDDKKDIKSKYDLQRREQKALRYCFKSGEMTDQEREEIKSYFSPIKDISWPDYRSRWIEQARKLSREF